MSSTMTALDRRRVLASAAGFGLLAGAAGLGLLAFAGIRPAAAAEIGKIHFLIPGGPGDGPDSGWDGAARGVGEALTKSGLVNTASYRNMSGGGGGEAIAHLIETADRQHRTLMVTSTPIIIRSLQKVFPQSFRDLTPIAAVVANYGAFVVKPDSPLQTWQGLLEAFRANPRTLRVAGGSPRGGMDHLVAALAFQAAGEDPLALQYVPYDAGGKALASLLAGEAEVLSTGLGEVLSQHRKGQVRILAITADQRTIELPEVPTLVELGTDAVFADWRGFFGAPGLPSEKADLYAAVLGRMYETPDWEIIRERNGWTNLYKAREDFTAFLEGQEQVVAALMDQLGMLAD
jgi:putative tricarboxylic transport membrane protein